MEYALTVMPEYVFHTTDVVGTESDKLTYNL